MSRPLNISELRRGKRFLNLIVIRHGDVIRVRAPDKQTGSVIAWRTKVGEGDLGNFLGEGLVNAVHVDLPANLPGFRVLSEIHEQPGA